MLSVGTGKISFCSRMRFRLQLFIFGRQEVSSVFSWFSFLYRKVFQFCFYSVRSGLHRINRACLFGFIILRCFKVLYCFNVSYDVWYLQRTRFVIVYTIGHDKMDTGFNTHLKSRTVLLMGQKACSPGIPSSVLSARRYSRIFNFLFPTSLIFFFNGRLYLRMGLYLQKNCGEGTEGVPT